MVAAAHRRYRSAVRAGRLKLNQMSGETLPLGDDSVDALMTISTVYCMTTYRRCSRRCIECCVRTDGCVVGVGDPK